MIYPFEVRPKLNWTKIIIIPDGWDDKEVSEGDDEADESKWHQGPDHLVWGRFWVKVEKKSSKNEADESKRHQGPDHLVHDVHFHVDNNEDDHDDKKDDVDDEQGVQPK